MNTTGYYGKLPLRGDFVSGRFPSTFKNLWDDWSQQLVTVCDQLKRDGVGDQDLWFQLPIYRFYLSGKMAGDNAWIGVMLPSCDSVGRLFPFCLARDIEANIPSTTAFAQFETYLSSIENLLQNIYSGEFNFEALDDSLAQLDNANLPTINPTAETYSGQSTGNTVCIKVGAQTRPDQTGFWQTTAQALLDTSFAAHSVWTTSPISNSETETLVCEAMPTADSCRGFFTGEFTQQHWTTVDTEETGVEKRQMNSLAKRQTPTQQPAIQADEGDTKPIHKLPADQQPRTADFLELDGNDSTDAPWDD